MPGPLRDVEQKVVLDASGYREGARSVIADNIAMRDSIRDVLADIAKVQSALRSLPDSKEITITTRYVTIGDKPADLGDVTRTVYTRYVNSGDSGAGAGGGIGADPLVLRELRDSSAGLDMVNATMGRVEEHLLAIRRDSAAAADYAAVTATAASRNDSGGGSALAAAALAGGGGGGGGGRAALAAAAGAAAGGRGGGGGGGFVPWAGGGWQAVRFWGMMAAETASTVIPAITAAGAAAAVGMQGFEQLQNRIQSVFTASEALGGAFGTTTGQFFGGGNALQRAQDAAQGGVWELAGGLSRIGKSGAGGGFLNLGTQTLGMIDRGAANLVTNVISGGTGNKLLAALGGGPGYLQQFGDIAGNLGTAALGFAPNLPGVGADMLSTLTGASGLLRSASGLPAPLLKGFFGYEALSRWGPALLGGQGLIGRMLGLGGVGGIGGLLGRAGGFLAERAPLGSALEGLGFGLSGAGGALGALTGPEIGIPGALLMAEFSALNRLPGGADARAASTIAALQGQVTAGGFSSAFTPLAHAVTVAAGGAAGAPVFPGAGTPVVAGRHLPAGRVAAGLQAAAGLSAGAQYGQAAQGFAQQMGELVGAGPQLVTALKKLGMHGVTLANAFQMAQDAMIDIPHAFGPGGKLNKTAMSQLASYVQAIGPMTQSPGAFGAAVAGQQIMSSGAMQNLAKVNQSLDSMTQIMQAGPAGMASLAATRAGLPAGAMAHALTSFTSPAGSAAWTRFAGTSGSSVISQMQQFNDQMRSYLTLGSLNQGQAAGLTGMEMRQFLPMARQSPAALAMLMQQGAQMGVGGYYDPSKSLAKNYQDAAAAAKKFGDSNAQAQKDMTGAAIKTANLPAVAKNLLGQTGPAIQAQQVAKIAQDAMNIQGGIKLKVSTGDLVSQLKAAGVHGGAALQQSLDAVLKQAGVGKAMRVKIEADVAKPKIPHVPDQHFNVNGHVHMPAIPHIPNQSFTITGHVVIAGGAALGIPASSMPGGPAGMRIHAQTGGLVPGTGRGDITPAMLEPGEAVVPRSLVPLVAPVLAAHNVPGFGSVPSGKSDHFAAGGVVGLPGAMRDLNTVHHVISGVAGQFAFTLIDQLTKALSSAGAGKIAQALVSQIAKEAAFAKNVSAASVQGLNLAGMQVPAPGSQLNMHPAGPGTKGFNAGQWNAYVSAFASDSLPGGANAPAQPQSVQQQMQSYLHSIQSFTKDLGTLRKDHLNKSLLSQLIGAGPVQGDALAQSILGGQGGAGAVNNLWAQINRASKALGAGAAQAMYGGHVAPGGHSGSAASGGVTINISGGGSGGLALTDKEIKLIAEKVQVALLKQAKRNNQTGVKLKGKGA